MKIKDIPSATEILISNELDPKKSLPELTKLGFESAEILRIVGLIPIVCGRILLSSGDVILEFPNHYIVTNNGRSHIKISFNDCVIYQEIYSYINNRSDDIVVIIGSTSCEIQALNWGLNQLEEAGYEADLTKLKLQAPELLF